MPDVWIDVDAAVTVPVNILPLIDDTDFKSRETAIAYNESGMDLVFNFVTCAGVQSQTAVTPTTSGDYDWSHKGDGMYNIEIPASGGASINNDTEGFGWFTGVCDGVLPWRGPVIAFRASGLNDKLIDSAYSATRGLTGTAVPDAASDAAGGLPISDTGGLDMDAMGAVTDDLAAAAGTMQEGTVSGSPTTTSVPASDLPAGLDDNHYRGNVIKFTSGNLNKQSQLITAYNGTTKTLTTTEFTQAPSVSDTFVIV